MKFYSQCTNTINKSSACSLTCDSSYTCVHCKFFEYRRRFHYNLAFSKIKILDIIFRAGKLTACTQVGKIYSNLKVSIIFSNEKISFFVAKLRSESYTEPVLCILSSTNFTHRCVDSFTSVHMIL